MVTMLAIWTMLGLQSPVLSMKGAETPTWVCTPPPGKVCGTGRREPPARNGGGGRR